jgi:hypothetical protein
MPTLLSAFGGETAMLLSGAQPMRRAHREEWGKLPVLGFWGYDHIISLAEKLAATVNGRGLSTAES